jgi:hypothetical protein
MKEEKMNTDDESISCNYDSHPDPYFFLRASHFLFPLLLIKINNEKESDQEARLKEIQGSGETIFL